MPRLRPDKSVEANFRRVMPRLLQRYLRRGRKVVRARAANEKLHRFRIQTKRMRYITELYLELFPRALRRVEKEFRRLQNLLGELQDQSMIQAWFERRLGRVRNPRRQAEYQRVLHRARARQTAIRAEFFRRWEKLESGGFGKKLISRIKKA